MKLTKSHVVFSLFLLIIDYFGVSAFCVSSVTKTHCGQHVAKVKRRSTTLGGDSSSGRGDNGQRKRADAVLAAELITSSSDSVTPPREVSVGFIGCGTIASAIATGLSKQQTFPERITAMTVSKRSEKNSQYLKDTLPGIITIEEDNQKILDTSDIVFLCVLPQQEKDVLSTLNFQGDKHTLVSVVATSKLDQLAINSGLPRENIFKMICLPPVAELEGTCLLVPKGNKQLKSLFESLGGCVECESEKIMNALMIPGCLMGPMYGILKNNRDWLVQQGVPAEDASFFVGRQYLGIIRDAERNCLDPQHFDQLIAEQTPGGLNEQVSFPAFVE
mmetsp:Transcript_8455/g.15460  ORF Transcript_8455/g.15460 Transcript_8455/m.15460 type:complete len:332 (-) Transcript_8455:739-1734(-)|eukprot:CAMPEP_0197454016 /NCGR_PEP_ID=MMETSP1175-20131217/36734_1 /TAXON_ID=1003142 /ORGANISM="Triceratium dubium, Strain CCMP147" /LENGTH=331 /DNA_ID=CAMNT_0042987477 /DNA_START=93 /DNA_END=1088 /DNA_ORIENTATION=+